MSSNKTSWDERILPGEGDVKIIKRTRVRRECDYCYPRRAAGYKNTYLKPRARINPDSSAYGRDDCTWCSDHDDYLCPECHAKNRTENVPSGYEWCSTFPLDRFPQMFLRWDEKEMEE